MSREPILLSPHLYRKSVFHIRFKQYRLQTTFIDQKSCLIYSILISLNLFLIFSALLSQLCQIIL